MEPAGVNQDGKAPIHLAAARGHMGVVNFLLERGTYINMQDFQARAHWIASCSSPPFFTSSTIS